MLLSEQFHYIQHFILFQYISCYSLSGSIGELSVVNRLFQYISCYSLSIKTMVSVGIRKVSIHLMLLFIGLLQSNSEPHSPFQYISCYSLSVTGNTYGAKDVRFNTSHVTLYQNRRNKRWKDHYCFNTSHVTLYRSIIKNIWITYCSFNTSHVTLYQASQNALTAADSGFNTSHVTLYLNGKM